MSNSHIINQFPKDFRRKKVTFDDGSSIVVIPREDNSSYLDSNSIYGFSHGGCYIIDNDDIENTCIITLNKDELKKIKNMKFNTKEEFISACIITKI